MRALSKAVVVALVVCAGAGSAQADTINVRIEGTASTIFEGPVVTGGHSIQAASDSMPRTCDSTNNGANSAAAPTPTAAAADALSLIGGRFDGDWYDGYEDYLIHTLGERNSGWGLTRNEAVTTSGGCQVALSENDRVLWAAGLGSRGRLGMAFGAAPGATTSAQPGQPVAVRVLRHSGQGGAAAPAGGVTIAEVATAGNGTQTPGATVQSTTADGSAAVAFASPGWHRIKATGGGDVRSNRLDICVVPCPNAPTDLAARLPAPGGGYPAGGRVVVSKATLRRSDYERGRVAIGWKVTSAGVGLRRWAVASDDLTSRARRYVRRATGSRGSSARLRLAQGRVYALRFTALDRLGRSSTADFGRVAVPIDERSRSVRRTGPWRKARARGAWKRTILRGRRGARLKVKLAAGRPALLLRGRRTATLRIGSKLVRVRPGRRTVLGPKRKKAGFVTITVTRGSIDLDGLAASP